MATQCVQEGQLLLATVQSRYSLRLIPLAVSTVELFELFDYQIMHRLIVICNLGHSFPIPLSKLTILVVLVSARPSVVISSFHEPEQLGSVGGAFSSQLQLSGTHCHFTFAPRPSVAVSFEQGQESSFQAGLLLTFPLRTVEEVELN